MSRERLAGLVPERGLDPQKVWYCIVIGKGGNRGWGALAGWLPDGEMQPTVCVDMGGGVEQTWAQGLDPYQAFRVSDCVILGGGVLLAFEWGGGICVCGGVRLAGSSACGLEGSDFLSWAGSQPASNINKAYAARASGAVQLALYAFVCRLQAVFSPNA
jgi:hypothetical protein